MISRRTTALAAPALLCLALAACTSVSDTGFEGRWARRLKDVESIVSIGRTEDGTYTFCWDKAASGSEGDTRCVRPGRTEVFLGPDAVYAWNYTVEERGGDGEDRWLRVEIDGKPLDGRSTPVSMVDRLELEPGNLTMRSYTLELNGRESNPPSGPLRFAKIDDDPA